MSVVVMTRFQVDASVLEELARGEHGETLKRVADVGRSNGAIHHEFIQDPDGSLIALDEWESEEAFQQFFEHQDDIRRIMADARVTSQPVSTTYRMVEAPDRF